MLPNNTMDVAAVEGAPIEDFSPEAVKSLLAEAQKVAAGSGSEQDIAEAKIEIEVPFLFLVFPYLPLSSSFLT